MKIIFIGDFTMLLSENKSSKGNKRPEYGHYPKQNAKCFVKFVVHVTN